MQGRRTHTSRLLAAGAATAVVALATGPPAVAKARIPDPPNKSAASTRVTAPTVPRAQRLAAEIVALGYDSYSGLELYVVRVGGRVVGMPFG